MLLFFFCISDKRLFYSYLYWLCILACIKEKERTVGFLTIVRSIDSYYPNAIAKQQLFSVAR